MGAANILVVLGKLSREAELLGKLVPIALENGLDLLEAIEAGLAGNAARRVEPVGRVLLAQVQQAQADPVGLLRMRPALQLGADPNQRVGPVSAAQFFKRPGVHCCCA